MFQGIGLLHVFVVIILITDSDEQYFRSPKDDCACYTDLFAPICASNGETYSNPCYLDCAKRRDPSILGLCHGECPCCKQPYINEPPSPGWGNMKSDSSFWRRPSVPFQKPYTQNVEARNSGRSKDATATAESVVIEEIEGCPCPKIFKPVCGSDNSTYANSCLLECQKEQENPCLVQACPGYCPCCSCTKSS